ncbi:hypothetical protein B0T17DRAFT_240449 [Bombardia bombarda]|uniref:Uncharacterized protein n=1 Tax=Bombardia bombarda TaxID=252184 RepID=A0AA40CAH1_9PEZI|nr:hypothetical protein B0T17DRAFT_240449 [Bombardia bombarda]
MQVHCSPMLGEGTRSVDSGLCSPRVQFEHIIANIKIMGLALFNHFDTTFVSSLLFPEEHRSLHLPRSSPLGWGDRKRAHHYHDDSSRIAKPNGRHTLDARRRRRLSSQLSQFLQISPSRQSRHHSETLANFSSSVHASASHCVSIDKQQQHHHLLSNDYYDQQHNITQRRTRRRTPSLERQDAFRDASTTKTKLLRSRESSTDLHSRYHSYYISQRHVNIDTSDDDDDDQSYTDEEMMDDYSQPDFLAVSQSEPFYSHYDYMYSYLEDTVLSSGGGGGGGGSHDINREEVGSGEAAAAATAEEGKGGKYEDETETDIRKLIRNNERRLQQDLDGGVSVLGSLDGL